MKPIPHIHSNNINEIAAIMTTAYTYRRSGTTGCEIIDGDGSVIAWAADAGWAALIVAALNWAGFSRPAPCHQDGGGVGPVEVGGGHGDRRTESDD
jgi:hypothetical protein